MITLNLALDAKLPMVRSMEQDENMFAQEIIQGKGIMVSDGS